MRMQAYHTSSDAFRQRLAVYFCVHCLFLSYTFFFSLIFSRAYLYGDQIYYRELYESLASASIYEIRQLQLILTGSAEPLYGLVAWLGAQVMADKDVFFSIINTFFGLLLLRLLLKNSASAPFIVLLFLNYYVFVLFGPAERLKVSFMFLLFAISRDRLSSKLLFVCAAIFSHFQSTILLSAHYVGRLGFFKLTKRFRVRAIFVGVLVISVVIYFLATAFLAVLLEKVRIYGSARGIESLSQLAFLCVICFVVLKRRRKEVIQSNLSLSVAVMILGPDRVNMIAVVLFVYAVIIEQKTRHPIVLGLMGYFAVKGIIFVLAVFQKGTGYG